MKKFFLLLFLLITSQFFSQTKVKRFNIDEGNSIPNQYIIYEFDNLSESELIKGLFLWVSRISTKSKYTILPSKKGLFLREEYDDLPFGYRYQNKIGTRYVAPIEYFYEIAVKGNKVRLLLKEIQINGNESIQIDDSSLYPDVKLRDIKYAYSINGMGKILKIINTKAKSLEMFLDQYSKGHLFSDSSLVSKKVELFGFNNDNNVFPFQYRVSKIEGEISPKDFKDTFMEFQNREIELNKAPFYPIFLHTGDDYFIAKFYFAGLKTIGFQDYMNLCVYYTKGEMYLAMDNLLETSSVYLSSSEVPSERRDEDFRFNEKVIYSYSPTSGFWESIGGVAEANEFFIQINALNKKGKEKKGRMEKPNLYSMFANNLNDKLINFFKEKYSSDSNW